LTALTHKSFLSNPKSELSNERLEFLGDTILDAVVAEYLYLKFPLIDEGELTKLKSKIVNRQTLSEIGEKMKIRELLKYNDGRTVNLAGMEGNTFEALVGAIYLDAGFERTKKTLNTHVFPKYIDIQRLLGEELDFKSLLFIWCQKKRLRIEFSVVSETKEFGEWHYTIKTLINSKEYAVGKGVNKKTAEQEAAKKTLEALGEI
jgi:ribonuclease III